MTWWSGARCVGIGVSVACLLAHGAGAQPPNHSKPFLLWPSGAVAFPTGRFAETHVDPDPSKSMAGQKAGFDAGFEAGYSASQFVTVGIGLDFARFDLDFDSDSTVLRYNPKDAHTSVTMAQLWLRGFPAGAYAHWRPYFIFGAGMGRPKGIIESPLHPQVARFENTIDTKFGVTVGVGSIIDVGRWLGLSVETRYRRLSTKGAGRKELRIYHDGTSQTFTQDRNGPLVDKSNTNWWELRAGVVISLL
ncbi:MAG: outer membrane beta-barrel protein [candidate division Zixibacteria bacterium]|nr:outer membrane beta-barrel protein [candidate division Zixibacteria bacterium]